jgi:hypothetical protein
MIRSNSSSFSYSSDGCLTNSDANWAKLAAEKKDDPELIVSFWGYSFEECGPLVDWYSCVEERTIVSVFFGL